jgi:hypothetical protein
MQIKDIQNYQRRPKALPHYKNQQTASDLYHKYKNGI